MTTNRLTQSELRAIRDALNFCLAGEEVFMDDEHLDEDPKQIAAAQSAVEKITRRCT